MYRVVYCDVRPRYASELRATYIALRHAQLPVTVLIEEDCVAGRLHYFDVLYVVSTSRLLAADNSLTSITIQVLPHITEAAAEGIASWVAAGGTVVVSAGGGLYNEANRTNDAMSQLLGVTEVARGAGTQDPFNATVRLIKQVCCTTLLWLV